MAAPETQRQPGGMGIGYQFTPSHYQPGNVNVPSDAGRLWAQVGETAMKASLMLQNTPLFNPQVRAQMQQEIERQHLGTQYAKFVAAHPKWMRAVTSLGPQGPTTTAPITQPVAQQTAEGIDWNEDDDQQQQPKQQQQQQQQPTITRTGANTGVDQNGKQYHETTPGSNQWIAGTPLKSPTQEAQEPGMYQGGLVRGYAPGGHVADRSDGSSDVADYERRMAQERQAVLGAPAGTFLNPATGSYEPLQTQASPPTTPSPGMFAGRAPAPPPAPTGQPQTNQPGNMLLQGAQPQDQTPGSAISQVTPQPGVALADWQNQNVHPVIAPKQVLDAVRTNVTTQAQDATYLPNGGVNGEPAWAIHMKGGGQTTISASQLAQQPWGRALMATHNLSEVFEAQNQGQPQPGQQPGQPPQQPYPTIASDQGGPQGQPPAAPGPTPMPSGTGAGAPQGSPAATTAYNPAAYQMPQGPTIAATGEVNPALMAGGTNSQAKAAADAAADPVKAATTDVPTPADKVAKMNADANSKNPNLDWKTDENGKKYIAGPQDPQNLFYTQRFYPLTGGFQSGPWNMDNLQKQQLLDAYGSVKGPPTDKLLTKDDINQMTPEERLEKLNRARWWANTSPITQDSPFYQQLFAKQEASKNIQRILDIDEATHKAGKPTAAYGTTEEGYSGEVARRNALLGIRTDVPTVEPPTKEVSLADPGFAWNWLWGGIHGALAGGHQYSNPVADDMTSAKNNLLGWLGVMHNTTYPSIAEPGAAAAINIHGSSGIEGASGGVSQRVELPGSDPSGLIEVNRLLQGGDRDAAIAALKRRKSDLDRSLQTDILNAPLALQRVPDNMRDNNRALLNNQPLPDNANAYRDTNGNVRIPPEYKRPFGDFGAPAVEQSSSPSPQIPLMNTAKDVQKFVQSADPDKPFTYDSGDGRGPQVYWTPKKKQ